MSATLSSALKAYVEGLGLGLSAYRDRPPQKLTPPYVTISEGVAKKPTPELDGNGAITEMAQVDLWQSWRKTDKSEAESNTLASSLANSLNGARINSVGSSVVYAVIVQTNNRLTDEQLDNNIVHNAITLIVYRQP